MSLGSKQQTSTQTSQPWPEAQPALKTGLADAQTAYKSGIGSQPYTGSTVVPYSQQSTQAFGDMQHRANSWQPTLDRNFEAVAGNMQQGGLNALQRGAVDQLTPISQSNPLEGTGQFNDVQLQAFNYLNPIADGQSMQGNPYLDDVIARSARDIQGASNLGASAAGRYGSGSHQGVTERNVGDMSSGLRFADYNTQQGRKDAAIRDLFGMGGQANQQYEADMGRKMDSIGSLFNAGQQQQSNINANTGALSDAYGAAMMPSQTNMDVGGQYEDLFGRQMNDQLRIFNEQQNQPWNQIGRLNAVASGAGQMGSSGQTTAQGPSRLSSGLGGALGGYSMFGPVGALGGGLAGLFG
jgi:hypothetical protein